MTHNNGYQIYHLTEHPIKIYGLAVTDAEKRTFYRLPLDLLEKMPQYEHLGRRSTGGRVRFATDSKTIFLRMTLEKAQEDINIPLSGSAGADIYLGKGKSSQFLGCLAPCIHTQEEITTEKIFTKTTAMDTVTINLPRNDLLLDMEIGIEENACIMEAPEYTISDPIIFYGSSITEGGCSSRVGNAYTSIVCRWLDADYRNYGFSGRAKGEEIFAEYIAALPGKSVFVYDYDHNAPDTGHLQRTHENFFQIIRRANPGLPIIIMSRPDVDKDMEDSEKRRTIIHQTYQNAVQNGDRNVWFIDGKEFFGSEGRAECTVDGTHPNALGFMRMAEKLYPLLASLLL